MNTSRSGTSMTTHNISRDDILIMLMGEEDSGHSDLIDDVTGRSRSQVLLHQSMVETIRVPARKRLVLVDTPALRGPIHDDPPEFDVIMDWLNTMETQFGIRLTGIIYVLSERSSKSQTSLMHLEAFRRVQSNITRVANRKYFGLKDSSLYSLTNLDSTFSNSRFDFTSLLEITDLFMQDDKVDFRLVLDKTTLGFRFAPGKDKWWLINRRLARKAIYNAGSHSPLMLSELHSGTKDIVMNWMLRKTAAEAHIMWVYTEEESERFAQVIAELCHSQNLLLATFFFSHWGSMDSLIPSIVEQIGRVGQTVKELITDALGDLSILWESFAIQLNRLVLQPLVELGVLDFPSLIIIEGLHHCVPSEMQLDVVKGIAQSRQSLNSAGYPLRFLILSRPSSELKEAFKLIPASMVRCMALHDKRWPKFANFSAPRAIHSSVERHDPPRCHPKTRVTIRERLVNWATQKTSEVSPVLWFHGAPGTGKSAIAQTLAETLQSQDLLLATFFFSRTDPTRNTINPLAATIAFQIGTIIPNLQQSILEALDNNPRLMNEPFQSQFTNLVLQPLKDLAKENNDFHRAQLIIIIDGLDECFDQETQSQIVITLTDMKKKEDFPFRVLFVSRPEQHLESTFNTRVPSSFVNHLALDGSCVSDDDIRVFLEAQLGAMRQTHPHFEPLNQNWPDPSAIEQLVTRSLGQFVYASTIVKYISSSSNPPTCLDEILELRCKPEDEGLLSSELDILYFHLLSSVKNVGVIKMILGVILFVDPNSDFFAPLTYTQPSAAQTLSGIEILLGLKPGQAVTYISQLHPMIQCSDDGNIFVSHASVAEYLNDFNRSKSFHLDRSQVSTTLAARCFQIIKNGCDDLSTQYSYGRLPQLCIGLSRTSDVLGNLMGFRLSKCHRWCQLNADRVGPSLTEEDRSLFPWWYVTRFLTVLRQLEKTDAYSHQLSAFDELLRSILSSYNFEDFQLILAVVSTPMLCMNLSSKRISKLLCCLHVNQATLQLDTSKDGLSLLSFYHDGRSDDDCFHIGRHRSRDIVVDGYHQLLLDFFNDPVRSGKYALSSIVFALAALKCRTFICGIQGAATTAEADIDAMELAYSFLPGLLARAGKSVDILSFLQQGK